MKSVIPSIPARWLPDEVCAGDQGAELCNHAIRILEAVQLIHLGARAGLVWRLTGLEKRGVKRLYRQINGHPSPPGQVPFTDTWYRDDDRRMLQATLVWHLHQRLQQTGAGPARLLIDLFGAYRQLVPTPLLDITRAVFVLELVATRTWAPNRCTFCSRVYLAPPLPVSTTCPGCRLYFRYRCHRCGTRLEPKTTGRRRAHCRQCGCALD